MTKKRKYGYEKLADEIQNRILDGEWGINDKLPSIDLMEKMFPYSRMTIFKALRILATNGYLRMERGSGVYVQRDHLARRVALLFSIDLINPKVNSFSTLVLSEIRKNCREHGVEIEIFIDNMNQMEKNPDAQHSQLFDAIKEKRFEGLITVGTDAPISILQSERWHKNRIPHVDISVWTDSPFRVVHDADALLTLGLEYVASHGARSVALIASAIGKRKLEDALLRFSLTSRDDWVLPFLEQNPEEETFAWARSLLNSKVLPDAVFALDDISGRGAALAFLEKSAIIDPLPLFLTHANKDSGIFFPIPTVRVQFDIAELVNAATSLLFDQINGTAPKKRTVLIKPKVFSY